MNNMMINILGAVYTKIPKAYRPYVKRLVYWVLLRLRSATLLRRIHKAEQVSFLDFEIAFLETVEFLGPGKGEVLVAVHNTLVSPGTEKAVLCGLPGARRAFPYFPGYSAAGTVVKIGRKTNTLKIGDRVAGRIKHMSQAAVAPGGLFRIPDGVSFEEASFIELGIIVLQGIRKARIRPGDSVAVLGQGLIGQLANRVARLVGASQITAIARSRGRARSALTPGGADDFIALAENASRAEALQADVVIEAVGSPSAVLTAMQIARVGGKVVLLGSSRGLGSNVDLLALCQHRNLTLVGAHIGAMPDKDPSFNRWTYQQEGQLFLDLLASGRLSVSNLVTWRAQPQECNSVYETIARGGGSQVGITFDWTPA